MTAPGDSGHEPVSQRAESDSREPSGRTLGAPEPAGAAGPGTLTSPALFEALVRDNADMIAVVDHGGRFAFVSEAARWILGVNPDEWVGRDGFDLIHPDDLGLAAESLATTIASGSGVREPLLLRLRRADGDWQQVEILTNNLSSDERVQGLVITARDMSARRQAEQTADGARDLFEQAFDRAPIGMAIVDNDGSLRRVNESLANMLGSTLHELIGDNLIRLAHPDDRRAARDYAFQVLAGAEQPALEARFVRADGLLAWARATATTIRSDDGTPLHSVVQIEDVTEQQSLRQELHWAATHDPLTGLLNRTGLEAEYQRFCSEKDCSSAFILIDLDGFKPVNDTFGHAVGDRLLEFVAGRLRTTLRNDATIGRMGGDEFVAHVLGVSTASEAMAIGERIRAALAEPFAVANREVHVTGSVGVALLPSPVDLEEALVASDRASYEAKREGGNQVALAWATCPRASV